jgi:hypothetical protein
MIIDFKTLKQAENVVITQFICESSDTGDSTSSTFSQHSLIISRIKGSTFSIRKDASALLRRLDIFSNNSFSDIMYNLYFNFNVATKVAKISGKAYTGVRVPSRNSNRKEQNVSNI